MLWRRSAPQREAVQEVGCSPLWAHPQSAPSSPQWEHAGALQRATDRTVQSSLPGGSAADVGLLQPPLPSSPTSGIHRTRCSVAPRLVEVG